MSDPLLKCSLFRKIWKGVVQQTEVCGYPDGGAVWGLEADLSVGDTGDSEGFESHHAGQQCSSRVRVEEGAIG